MQILRPNAAAVAAKVIDGEAIIMNLTNGAYYSMDGAGAVIWDVIERGGSIEDIRRSLVVRYGIEPGRAQQDVERLVDQLTSEQLIVVVDGSPGADASSGGAPAPQVYHAPILHKYTEMADLLALDPPMPAIGELPAGPERA